MCWSIVPTVINVVIFSNTKLIYSHIFLINLKTFIVLTTTNHTILSTCLQYCNDFIVPMEFNFT